ncbi:MAG: hypothetical protein EOO48_03445 [Flavobacterium sp.]|nr:MAG: hypothetical protein EOO48_03445 [Flavobacterium sp.]
MTSKRERDSKDKYLKIMLAAFAGVVVGYYLLEHIAPIERVPLGQTFYIIAGCILIAASAIVMFFAIKSRYFPKKKKRKSSRPVFLKDGERKKSH